MTFLCQLRDRLLDTLARKPSGSLGRFVYGRVTAGHGGSPVVDRLKLQTEDIYLEIGQGGGLLLEQVLQTVSTAGAIDHSLDMAQLAKRRNSGAVAGGRLHVVQGDAGALPWQDDTFTCGACVATFLFFDDPLKVLKEIERVLKPGGRFLIATPAQAASGFISTLLAPWRNSMHLYTAADMERMLREAGFAAVEVETLSRRLMCYVETADGG